MRKPWDYISPALLGLLIYFTIRLVNDTTTGFEFWSRSWAINLSEVFFTVMLGYLMHVLMRRIERKTRRTDSIGPGQIVKDFLSVYAVLALAVNVFGVSFVALTDDGLSWGDFVQLNVIPVLYLLLFFAIRRGNFYLQHFLDHKLQAERAANQQLKAELDYLKQQIHPHFLFNSLNTIYFQMDESVEEAKKTLEQFSELLRYQLYEASQPLLLLGKELEHLQSFIGLQQKRYSSKLKLTTNWPENTNGWYIQPLLMLPLVENAFKYVGGNYKLYIQGSIEGTVWKFTIRNGIPNLPSLPKPDSGIGLKNLKRRLELLYPDSHTLEIEKGKEAFFVRLEVELKGNEQLAIGNEQRISNGEWAK